MGVLLSIGHFVPWVLLRLLLLMADLSLSVSRAFLYFRGSLLHVEALAVKNRCVPETRFS